MAFATFCFAIGVGCGARSSAPASPAFPDPGPVSKSALDVAIEGAADYIVRHTDDEGRFTYLLYPDGSAEPTEYNVLRHGGTLYALGEFRKHRGASPEIDQAITRAAQHLIENYLGPFERPGGLGETGSIAVWSRLGEEIDGERREAKLGGAGLGLVALAVAREVDSTIVPIETLRGLGLAIEAMQKPSGHFVSKVAFEKGPVANFVSLYYPGEAILGLARLYRADRDPRWLKVAGSAVMALVRERQDLETDELPADHWLLIAIAELAALSADDKAVAAQLPLSIDDMLEHAVRIADSMLVEQRASGVNGSFRDDRSTPTATRLEGILAVLTQLAPEHTARPRLHQAARGAVNFLLTCRVTEADAGARLGGITRDCPPGEGRRSGEIRIDYAQHALSAFLGARALGL